MTQQACWLKWSERVEAWQKSGLTQAEFSRQNNLRSKTLSAWVCRLKKAASAASAVSKATAISTSTSLAPPTTTTAPALVPVRIMTNPRPTPLASMPSAFASAAHASSAGIYLTHPNGWRVQLPQVDAPWLAQLLREL